MAFPNGKADAYEKICRPKSVWVVVGLLSPTGKLDLFSALQPRVWVKSSQVQSILTRCPGSISQSSAHDEYRKRGLAPEVGLRPDRRDGVCIECCYLNSAATAV